MVNEIRLIYPRGLNWEFGSKFYVRCQVRHGTPEECRKIYRLRREYSNEDEDNSPNTVVKIIKIHLRNIDY